MNYFRSLANLHQADLSRPSTFLLPELTGDTILSPISYSRERKIMEIYVQHDLYFWSVPVHDCLHPGHVCWCPAGSGSATVCLPRAGHGVAVEDGPLLVLLLPQPLNGVLPRGSGPRKPDEEVQHKLGFETLCTPPLVVLQHKVISLVFGVLGLGRHL